MGIITVSREFGSGGRELGKRLAEELGYSYYDTEIISEIARQTELSEKYIENISESGMPDFTFHFGGTFSLGYNNTAMSVFIAQQSVIKRIAEMDNCVIVGRGSDVILTDMKPLRLFVYATAESKLIRCRQKNPEDDGISDKQMLKKFKEIDRGRKKLHEMLSGPEWGKCTSYDLCINTSGVSIREIVPAVAKYATEWMKK